MAYHYDYQHIRAIFEEYDADHSRKLDKPEMRRLLPHLGIVLSEEELGNMVKQCDKTGLGALSFDDFYRMVTGVVPGDEEKKKEYDLNFIQLHIQGIVDQATDHKGDAAPVVSKAEFTRYTDGVKSNDNVLNDKSELLKFLAQHNTRPKAYLGIWGHHMERTGQEMRNSYYVTDFRYSFAIDKFVAEKGTVLDLDSVDGYLASPNTLKRVILQKLIKFDVEKLQNLVVEQLKTLGFKKMVRVYITVVAPEVKAEFSGSYARCLRHPATDVLCFFTGIGLIYYPLKWCYEDTFYTVALWPLKVEEDTLFQAISNKMRTSTYSYSEAQGYTSTDEEFSISSDANMGKAQIKK